MPCAHIVREVAVQRSARIMQMEGMFEVQPGSVSRREWDVNLPLDEKDWNIGLIVGPSGSGKSTVARELFGDALASFSWADDVSVLDAFPAAMSIKVITGLLSSVGFSSPPSWLRPYRALSTGEQFRVSLARLLAERPILGVMDEFTSVVDRKVAQKC